MGRFVFAPRSLAAVAIAAGLCSFASILPSPARAEETAPEPAADETPAPEVPVRRVGEVAITAARSERDVLDVPGNVTVIDRATIDRSGARDVPELLRREAGLFVTNDIGNAEGYRVEARGFNNGGGNGSSLLVLMDGRRINEADSSVTDWALVHLDRVERIEIVRGPVSTLYGDNAMTGVIQIITRDGQGAPQIDLRGRGGSYDSWEGSLFAGGSRGPLSGALFVVGDTTNGYRDESDLETHAFDGRLRWTPTEAASIEVQAGYSSDDRQRPGTLTLDEIDALGRNTAEPFNDRFVATHERFVQARGDVVLTDGVTFQLQPYWRSRRDDGAFLDDLAGSNFDFETDTSSWGGSSQIEVSRPVLGFGNRATAGVEFLREDVSREALSESLFGPFEAETGVHRRVLGLFLQEELSLLENLIVSGGVRYDRAHYTGSTRSAFAGFPLPRDELDDSPSVWSPKAALTWRFCDPTSAYASYGRGFRMPNFDEAIGFTGDLFDLGTQKSHAWEVGLKHRSARVSANVAFYWMNVEDEIYFNPLIRDFSFGFLSPQNMNLEEVRHRGIEAWASVRPLDWLELYGSYTLDDSRIEKDPITNLEGERMPITPLHRGTLGGVVTLPLGFEVGVNANLVGERSFGNDIDSDLDGLDGYYTIDAVLDWKRSLRPVDVQIAFRVRNLTDEKYEEFAAEPTFGLGPVGFNPAPGRNFEVAVSLSWRP